MPAPHMPGNPYPKGSGRYNAWNRREHDKMLKEREEGKDKTPIVDEVREELDKRPGYLKRRRDSQSSDSNQ